MAYVDGCLLAVPTANKQSYVSFSKKMALIIKKHGALSTVECWGEDIPEGKVNSMHSAVMRKSDETVIFSWVVWLDKIIRDKNHKRMVAEMETVMENIPIPFDGSRMIFGGFDVIVDD
jgi:uncharacterized protein YbaA (DUF1428 family)